LKALILNTFDGFGGAARSAHRLLTGLNTFGTNAELLVQEKCGDNPFVICPHRSRYGKIWRKLRITIDLQPLYTLYPKRQPAPYSLHWLPERRSTLVNSLRPDIVNLHWISAGLLRIESLNKIKAPMVWTLHDMWPFTGGCHISNGCDKFMDVCGACPILNSSRNIDLSRWIWRRKARAWKSLNLTVVAPSRWLAQKAKQSSLFKRFPIETIPNGLDTRVFRPVDKKLARKLLALPENEQIILFGSVHPDSDKNKGFHLLKQVLPIISGAEPASRTSVVVFGSSRPRNATVIGQELRYLGYIQDDITLALAYSAADVFALPSLQENLPNTVMEAMACGTPCVAFNVGGTPDMIEHRINGYLAEPFDVKSLASGILWVLRERSRSHSLSELARNKVLREFDLKIQVKRYQRLFHEVVNNNHSPVK